jgi:hypothetical protein
MALATMNENRRPKPKVTFFPGFEVPESKPKINPTPSERISRIREFEAAEKTIQEPKKVAPASIAKEHPKSVIDSAPRTSHSFRNFIIISLSILLVGGAVKWNADEKSHKLAVEQLNERNAFASKCFAISEEDVAAKSGSAGSDSREKAVVAFYDRVINSECVEYGDGSIFKNPFYKIEPNSADWPDLVNAFKYSAERWNGIESFVMRCRDGWMSPSIGKRGACSHHGGVVSGFNENKNWDLSSHIGNVTPLYPPLYVLEEAIN